MKTRWIKSILPSTVFSLCLISLLPVAIESAATWNQRQLDLHYVIEPNYLAMIGVFSLGFVTIGLIALWTGYLRREWWAWFVMFVITVFFVVPGNLGPLWLMQDGRNIQWGYWLKLAWLNDPIGRIFAPGLLIVLVMLAALLISLPAFFRSRQVSNRHREEH